MSSAPAEECLSWNGILAEMPAVFSVCFSPRQGVTILGPRRINALALALTLTGFAAFFVAPLWFLLWIDTTPGTWTPVAIGPILSPFLLIGNAMFDPPLRRIWLRVDSRRLVLGLGGFSRLTSLACGDVSRVLACGQGKHSGNSPCCVTENAQTRDTECLREAKGWLRIETVYGMNAAYGGEFRLTFPEALWLARAVRFALGNSWQDPAYSSVPQSAATTSGAPPSA